MIEKVIIKKAEVESKIDAAALKDRNDEFDSSCVINIIQKWPI